MEMLQRHATWKEQPSRTININDKNGTPRASSEEQHQCGEDTSAMF